MFYSENILTKKAGSLGLVWIAANFLPGVHHISLSRREYCSVSIKNACDEVMSPKTPMALRLSANLMVGIVRIHHQQTHYIYVESKNVWQRLKNAYEKNQPVTELPPGNCRVEAVTLPDPTAVLSWETVFPGQDLSISLDSIPMEDLFSLSLAGPPSTPSSCKISSKQCIAGSPFTADPRDISMEEETEAPLEALQIKVPGEVGDFGGGVMVEGQSVVMVEGQSVVMMDSVPLPTLDSSNNSAGMDEGWGEISGSSVVRVKEEEEVVEEEEEGDKERAVDQVLLYDDKSNSFQLYDDRDERTPIVNPVNDSLPDVEPLHQQQTVREKRGGPSKARVRRKLAFDNMIKIKSTSIKESMESNHTTIRDKHSLCFPVPSRVKPAVLLTQPVSLDIARCPELLDMWKKCLIPPPSLSTDQEFELERHANPTSSSQDTATSFPILDREIVRGGPSISQTSSPGGSTAPVEVVRAGDEQTMDSHHITSLTAIFSDVSSFASRREQSNIGFDTSSAQRMTPAQSRLIAPPGIDGLSPIPDVAEIETEASFATQRELEFPELDVSYGSSTAAPVSVTTGGHGLTSPTLESEPMAYFGHVARKMGRRLEIGFSELLPPNSSRRTASRAFSHILELVTSQVLGASQEQSYGAITLHRGPEF